MTQPRLDSVNIISLGAGLQSSAMALMAASGELTPMPVAAIFADTQAEPQWVYDWLAVLIGLLPYPVHVVSAGSLEDDALRVTTARAGHQYIRDLIPSFVRQTNGAVSLAWRKCTQEYKLRPIRRQQRVIMRAAGAKRCVAWLGISLDEAHRMKHSRVRYVENHYPLIESRITRAGCEAWLRSKGFPVPKRSACVFCPFHGDAEWKALAREAPVDFERAVKFEDSLRVLSQAHPGRGDSRFLHRSCTPLREVMRRVDAQQSFSDGWGNECEGMCGV